MSHQSDRTTDPTTGSTDPEPPSADELLRLDRQLCFSLHAASRAFDGLYRRVLSDTGLTYPQYLAMLVLWEYGEMPVKRLGEFLRLDSGTLSPLLKRMQTAGLVQRERSAHDERSVTVRLTAEGTALKERARGVPLKAIEASGLGLAEAVDLQARVRRLTAALDAALADEEA
ncbi:MULTISPECIES: MarR family winged helix-turn-helix transcriptional regulator [Streptomyces]|uniref:MarR family transcriptional regulator n=3 Tax=Streptomyces TaxID=1883 RepID=A0ABD5JEI0_9ACTN|nr:MULTISPECIES: MarR family transcriptional regulator [Streptomyces]MEE4586465.1 MarR family transcriptional regulator [Streptomyces sp. DSM 41602]WTA80783.1 MarR family transcriptional regulator [Streptomyces antimycoticus]KUL48187.1 MarR family transcriptional regulator [Streptomyces violaceusniger]RSS41607.1 MarR family transcriptional regulator [Streptomyces sp. WAC05858]WTB08776.1 MarR family transcriptional regulator [Streptomyces antimycoticus]